MIPLPQKTYGFAYQHNGREQIVDVSATSEQDARAVVAAISTARLIGELRLEEDPYTSSEQGEKRMPETPPNPARDGVKNQAGNETAKLTKPAN